MKVNSERFYQLAFLSKRIQIVFFILFPINTILGTALKITWIFYIAPVFITISWLVPGIMLIFGIPSMAQAWLRGIIWRTPATPWEELSTGQKLSISFNSLLCFVAAAGLIIMIVNANIR